MPLTLLLLLAPASAAEGSALNPADRPWALSLHAELGALAVPAHRIQFGKGGTPFDYTVNGGQDNLFFYKRLSAELQLNPRHALVFLYQPLDLRTTAVIDQDVVIDDLTFPAGTPMELRYGFDFYRVSWLYDFAEAEDRELALGASLQLRNATIDFRSADGSLQRSNRDVGPVPVIKLRGRTPAGESAWLGAEIDGFWAPIKYINGSNNDVEGAILDASLRAGLSTPSGIEPFLNLRYIGGGGAGTDSTPERPWSDGYVENWVSFVSLSLGASIR